MSQSRRFSRSAQSRGRAARRAAAIIPPIVVVTGPEDLVPDQLTERLRVCGALPFGRVTAVHAGERRTTILSTIVPLRLEYSPDAPREATTRLLLKGTRSGLDAGLQSVGEREVAFYSRAAPLMPGGPFPCCYDAESALPRRDQFRVALGRECRIPRQMCGSTGGAIHSDCVRSTLCKPQRLRTPHAIRVEPWLPHPRHALLTIGLGHSVE